MSIVWLIEEKCWATVVSRTSNYVIAKYQHLGVYHEEIFEYDDIMEPSEMGIDYEDNS